MFDFMGSTGWPRMSISGKTYGHSLTHLERNMEYKIKYLNRLSTPHQKELNGLPDLGWSSNSKQSYLLHLHPGKLTSNNFKSLSLERGFQTSKETPSNKLSFTRCTDNHCYFYSPFLFVFFTRSTLQWQRCCWQIIVVRCMCSLHTLFIDTFYLAVSWPKIENDKAWFEDCKWFSTIKKWARRYTCNH